MLAYVSMRVTDVARRGSPYGASRRLESWLRVNLANDGTPTAIFVLCGEGSQMDLDAAVATRRRVARQSLLRVPSSFVAVAVFLIR